MAILFPGELGGDLISICDDRGAGQIMVSIRSLVTTSQTAVLVTRINWNLDSPSWSSPVIVAAHCQSLAPTICGPLPMGRILVWYVNVAGSLALSFSDDAGGTWNAQ